jgi:glyoxylase-like metal-dependent hydrolase (beta-lactamase superfamily II)
MSEPGRKRELGRGERVLAGLWRLRLPLPWPGVPHCNAWAISAPDGGIVLVDTGMHGDDSMEQLERAMAMVGLHVEDVRLLVCTHAHSDHYGQAGPIVDRAGCELWMHPNHQHATRSLEDPEQALQRRLEVARTSGVPELVLRRYAELAKQRPAIARVVDPDLALLPGVEIATALGDWGVIETPGHAPSHVCLYQPERRILISGDHLLGRISLYYDYGWTPDPVGEFLRSLDAIEALKPSPRLCLAGHARPFTDVQAHIEANRELVAQRVAATAVAIEEHPLTAYEVVPHVHGPDAVHAAAWLLTETLCYLGHLEAIGAARREPGDPERWVAV